MFSRPLTGFRIHRMFSRHWNRPQDRQWALRCAPLPYGLKEITSDKKTTTNGWNEDFNYDFMKLTLNGFLTGIESHYDRRHWDRQYTFSYNQLSEDLVFDSCKWQTINKLNRRLYFQLGTDKVITGIQRKYNHRAKDRIFSVKTCSILEPVNCEWGTWTEYSACSEMCGEGIKKRKRQQVVSDKFGGKPCVGNNTETIECNEEECQGSGDYNPDGFGNYYNPIVIIKDGSSDYDYSNDEDYYNQLEVNNQSTIEIDSKNTSKKKFFEEIDP